MGQHLEPGASDCVFHLACSRLSAGLYGRGGEPWGGTSDLSSIIGGWGAGIRASLLSKTASKIEVFMGSVKMKSLCDHSSPGGHNTL